MEPGDSMLNWINPIPLLIPVYLRYILILSSYPRLDLPGGIFPVGLPVKILKALVPSSILATWPAQLNIIDLIILSESNIQILK